MRILFVDGPLIPASALLVDRMASFERKIPKETLAILNAICERTGAKVVMNTTHNRDYFGITGIHIAMEKHGFNPEYFHEPQAKTQYPEIPRDKAVTKWVKDNLTFMDDYVCVDDVVCADDKHMELIDPIIGLTIRSANRIIRRWGGDPLIFCI